MHSDNRFIGNNGHSTKATHILDVRFVLTDGNYLQRADAISKKHIRSNEQIKQGPINTKT